MRIIAVEVSPQLQTVLDDLERRIVASGGTPLDAPCVPQPFAPTGEEEDATCGCGNETRFRYPYEDEMEREREVTACAHCDYALRWPVLLDE